MPDDARIVEQNPWWRAASAIASDPHLKRLRGTPFRWDPPALADIPARFGDLDTLRGPRQVGKTTTAKRVIERLLGRGEQRVLYYSFDIETHNTAIPDVIRRAKVLSGHPPGPWFIFLDEVTSIPDWQRGVKYAWDVGLTRGDYVLCTGSSARHMGTEQLPGRRGKGRNYLQLPMSFRDFCTSVAGMALPAGTVSVGEIGSAGGRALLKRIYLEHESLQAAFLPYHRVGGFPAAVGDYVSEKAVSAETLSMAWAMLSHEIQRAGLDPTASLKLIERVAIALGSPLSWKAAAEAMGVGSHNTAHHYAKTLAECFAILTVYHWTAGGSFEPRKQRKLYFLDPLFAQLPTALAPGARAPNDDGMIESLVAAGLFRSSSEHVTQFEAVPGALGYWRSRQGREVDFVVPVGAHGKGRIPVEVKGDGSAELRNAAFAVTRSFGKGVVLTRTVFEPERDVPLIPVPVFLAALPEHTERRLSTL